MTETVEFGSPNDVPGTTTIWARLNAADAALMEHNVEAMARSVCDADPRGIDQRRAHALAASANHTAFQCQCTDPDRPGGTTGDTPAKNAVVYAVVDDQAVDDHKVEHTTEAAAKPSPTRSTPGMCSAPGSCRTRYGAPSWRGPTSARSPTPAATLCVPPASRLGRT